MYSKFASAKCKLENCLPHQVACREQAQSHESIHTHLAVPIGTIGLFPASNILMTYTWHGHSRFRSTAFFAEILINWGITFFEHCLMVPADRAGHGYFMAVELNTIQEANTLSVFAVFSVLCLKEALMWNHLFGVCLHRTEGVLHLSQMGVTMPRRSMDKAQKQA